MGAGISTWGRRMYNMAEAKACTLRKENFVYQSVPFLWIQLLDSFERKDIESQRHLNLIIQTWRLSFPVFVFFSKDFPVWEWGDLDSAVLWRHWINSPAPLPGLVPWVYLINGSQMYYFHSVLNEHNSATFPIRTFSFTEEDGAVHQHGCPA